MKICKASINQYVDVYKQILRGYEELEIFLSTSPNTTGSKKLVFDCNWLQIDSVIILITKNPPIKAEYFQHKSDKALLTNNKLTVNISEAVIKTMVLSESGLLKIRIVYSSLMNSPGIFYYQPVAEDDVHRELVVKDPSFAFPALLDCYTDISLSYILPNSNDVQIGSVGIFKLVEEISKSIIYRYKADNFGIKNIIFSVGTYKMTQIADAVGIYIPSKCEYDLSELVYDYKNTIQFLNTFSDCPAVSIVFTLNDINYVDSQNLIIFNLFMLGGVYDVEANFKLKKILCYLLAKQIFMYRKFALVDSWIFQGITGYLGDHLYKHLVGHNEFIYQFMMDKEYVYENDVVEPPLFYPYRILSGYDSQFFKLKSKLVFHSLDSNLSMTFIKKIISSLTKLENKLSLSSDLHIPQTSKMKSHENLCLNENTENSNKEKSTEISITSYFIKLITDSSNVEMKKFFDFYVFKPGLLEIQLIVKNDGKKGRVEVTIEEKSTSSLNKCNCTYFTSIPITSIETEGKFNHSLYVGTVNEYFIHKKGEEGDLLYVKADPKRECSMNLLKVVQHDFMHVEQLLENEAYGQLEAIKSLQSIISENILAAFDQVLDSPHTFFRIKQKIFDCLKNIRISKKEKPKVVLDDENSSEIEVKAPTTRLNYSFNGMMRLIQMFIKLRCLPNSTILKSSASGIANFLIQKALIKAIIEIDINSFINDNGGTWDTTKEFMDGNDQITKAGLCNDISVIIAFLKNIINYNDSTREFFDDPYYLFCVLNKYVNLVMLLNSLVGQGNDKYKLLINECLTEVERFRLLDMAFPSYNNLISKACLLSLIRLGFHSYIQVSFNFLIEMFQEPNFIKLRILALEGLLLLHLDKFDFKLLLKSSSDIMIQHFLEISIKMIEYEFVEIGKYLKRNKETLRALKGRFSHDRNIADLFIKLDLGLSGNVITTSEYMKGKLKDFNSVIAMEKNMFEMNVEKCLGLKSLIIRDYNELRLQALKKTMRLRLSVPKVEKIIENNQIIVRLKCKRIPCKICKINTILRFKYNPKKLIYTNIDIPNIILSSIKNNKQFPVIDKILNSALETVEDKNDLMELKKFQNMFAHDFKAPSLNNGNSINIENELPLFDIENSKKSSISENTSLFSFKEIQSFFTRKALSVNSKINKFTPCDCCRHVGRHCLCNFIDTLYASLRVIMINSKDFSKMYNVCKSIMVMAEKNVYFYSKIIEGVTLIDNNLLILINKFFDDIYASEDFEIFKEKVDTGIFKTYFDFVRFPICLNQIKGKLCGEYEVDKKVKIIRKNQCFYRTFEAFYYDVERVGINARMFNVKNSVIYNKGTQLIEELFKFRKEVTLLPTSSKKVLDFIIKEGNVSNVDFGFKEEEIITWNDFDEFISTIKKKHSRNSSNGKALSDSVSNIYLLIYRHFSLYKSKLLKIID